eukprot:TRINITY_DN614_c0_g1_i1.p1 TRINITY_DN614_c0_g1~~TRINITY_DN614_c0_g1_i1.p1  ORF type:complete len:496 (+),score=135.55 TRINITY_DN614_c0_g1_i1:26-1513(+)
MTSSEDSDVLVGKYRMALRFFKANECRRRLEVSYADQIRLVAYTQQVVNGPFTPDKGSPLGTLDVIGKDRRSAWKALGDMSRSDSMKGFVDSISELFPDFKLQCVEAESENSLTKNDDEGNEEESRESLEPLEEEEKEKTTEEPQRREEEVEKKVVVPEKKKEEELDQQFRERQFLQEDQRRQIQDALNKQTFSQFKAFAEKQYPNSPDQQAVLIKRLQAQYYYQYMQTAQQQQQQQEQAVTQQAVNDQEQHILQMEDKLSEMVSQTLHVSNNNECPNKGDVGVQVESEIYHLSPEDDDLEDDDDSDKYDEDHVCSDDCGFCQDEEVLPANMWTKKDINVFKESIRQGGGDSVIKVGQGETVTVRVPTHDDGGSALFWEFATDGYDIGFGLFFEWTKSEDENIVTVHVSDSEDEDLNDDDSYNDNSDPERASTTSLLDKRPPMSIIVPIYRRDCHEEVYAGSHTYPGQGVYLLKFDNTYSLWRSKTLYYRVYYAH